MVKEILAHATRNLIRHHPTASRLSTALCVPLFSYRRHNTSYTVKGVRWKWPSRSLTSSSSFPRSCVMLLPLIHDMEFVPSLMLALIIIQMLLDWNTADLRIMTPFPEQLLLKNMTKLSRLCGSFSFS